MPSREDVADGAAKAAPSVDRPVPSSHCRRRRLTKTQRELLRYIGGETAVNGGVVCTKRDLARLTGRCEKTIDRCLAGLRREGFVEVEMRFGENGAQLGSRYRAVALAKPNE